MLLHCKNANSSIWYQYNMRKMDKIEKKREEKEFNYNISWFFPFLSSSLLPFLLCSSCSALLVAVLVSVNSTPK